MAVAWSRISSKVIANPLCVLRQAGDRWRMSSVVRMYMYRRQLVKESGKCQIPPDFVVKSQAIDIMDVIRSRIRRQNVVQTLSSNRLSRYKPLSASEVSWFTTKSVGV